MTDHYTDITNSPRLWAVVPAAGSGRRFGGETPKQYLSLLGQPVMLHSIDRLFALPLAGAVLAISADDTIARHLPFLRSDKLHFVTGGAERMDSVLAGLDYLTAHALDEDWVLVHDVARPCVAACSLDLLWQTVTTHGVGAILAIPVRDTLKRATGDYIDSTVSRVHLWQAQTPQIFRYAELRHALQQAREQGRVVTDEASAMEQAGHPVRMVEGRADNIKITYPDDLALAAAIMQAQKQ
jgi:2-C-methyl-D-erythritol 4-phosphate cytidylyltransferase